MRDNEKSPVLHFLGCPNEDGKNFYLLVESKSWALLHQNSQVILLIMFLQMMDPRPQSLSGVLVSLRRS